jgi:hypothetical protein
MAEVEAKPTTPPGPSPDATPAWFIAGPDLSSVGERRERNARDQVIAQLQTIFPETSTEDLAAAVVIGGDLQVIVDRILAMQAQDDAEAAVAATESGAGSSSSATPGPTRRVRFAAKMATSEPRQPMEQMTLAGTDAPPPPGILVTNGKAKASAAAPAAEEEEAPPPPQKEKAAGGGILCRKGKYMQIWKWTLEATQERQHIDMPKGAQVLSVQIQHGHPQLWALVDMYAPKEVRNFSTYGTGNPLPQGDDYSRFVGTYQLPGCELVFHVFEQ